MEHIPPGYITTYNAPAMSRNAYRLTALVIGMLFVAGCSTALPSTATVIAETALPMASPTLDPSLLAALVGSEPITLSAFEDELVRFEGDQLGLGTDLATLENYRSQVLQAMIDRLLLAQGAQAAGLGIDDLAVMERLGGLILQIGGQEILDAWMQANFYTLETLLAALTEEMLAAKMVEKIVSELPLTAEQIHASHILVADQQSAQYLYQQILAGYDFATLAMVNSTDTSTRLAGGDLGWFPRGTLTMPEVEEIAFALEPGEVSQPVESVLGFHIVKCNDRGEHPLSPQAILRQREDAVASWLNAQRDRVEIEIFITP